MISLLIHKHYRVHVTLFAWCTTCANGTLSYKGYIEYCFTNNDQDSNEIMIHERVSTLKNLVFWGDQIWEIWKWKWIWDLLVGSPKRLSEPY